MAGGAAPRPPGQPRGSSARPPRSVRVSAVLSPLTPRSWIGPCAPEATPDLLDGVCDLAASLTASLGASSRSSSPYGASPINTSRAPSASSARSRERSARAAARPQTHCGSMWRAGESCEADDAADACSAAGAAALESVRGGCPACAKLRLRLEHTERARVRAQEQLARLQSDSVRARRQPNAAGYPAEALTPRADSGSPSGAPNSGAQDYLVLDGDVGPSLEGYRREVSMLREALRERDAREAAAATQQRRQKAEQEAARQEWEGHVAGLLCEVQDLEARNRELEGALRHTATPATASTEAASARGTRCTLRTGRCTQGPEDRRGRSLPRPWATQGEQMAKLLTDPR